MDKQKQPSDEYAEQLRDVKYVLEHVIIRYERDLRHFPMAFLVSLGFTLLGLSIIWAVMTDATVFVIGRTHFKLEPFSFGASSAFFHFLRFLSSCVLYLYENFLSIENNQA